jgi:hypothetical protein
MPAGSTPSTFGTLGGAPTDNAALAAALASAGGSTIDLTLQSWVDATAGDDLTGEVGSPAAPYETIQAAYDDGARVFHVNGSVGALSLADATQHVVLLGVGRDRSLVGAITLAAGSSRTVQISGNGAALVSVASITTTSPSDTTGAYLLISSLYLSGTLVRSGMTGSHSTSSTPSNPGAPGGTGGYSGPTKMTGVEFNGHITFTGGNGGTGGPGDVVEDFGSDGGEGGAGGFGGELHMVRCSSAGTLNIVMSGGYGGAGGDPGSGAESTGNPGNSGPTGDGGNLTLEYCNMPNVTPILSGGNPGNLISQFSIYSTPADYAPGGEVANIIAGVWTP